MPARDLSNKRIQMWMGPASALSSYDSCTSVQLGAMLMVAPAVRWDGLDFGMQASEQIDDRTLDDDATATIRGFMQFGGGIPFLFPKVTDSSSMLRQSFNLLKVRGTELAIVERIGWADRRVVGTAGDNVNIYKAMTDGFTPDTEGTGGYAYIQSLVPRGSVAPWSVVAGASPVAVTIAGAAITGTVGTIHLRRATYIGNDVTARATWLSSNPAVATVQDGIVELVSAGSATITANMPGGLASTTLAVTAT